MSEQKPRKQGWLGRLIGKKQDEAAILPDSKDASAAEVAAIAASAPPDALPVQAPPAIAEIAAIVAAAPPDASPVDGHPVIAELAQANAAAAEVANFSQKTKTAGSAATETPVFAAGTEIFDIARDAAATLEHAHAKHYAADVSDGQAAESDAAPIAAAPIETSPESDRASDAEKNSDISDLAKETFESAPAAEPLSDVEPTIADQSEQPESAPKLAAHLLAFGGETLENDKIPVAEKSGWFTRIRKGLSRSSHKISDGIADFMIRQKLDDQALDEMEDLLITSDLGVKSAARLSKKLSRHRFAANVNATMIKEDLAEEIASILSPFAAPLIVDRTKKPHVILVVGVNGSGKTTTIGKLAKYYRDHDLAVSMVAGDTFRAAAVEQLKVWGERAGCPVISGSPGADAAGLAFDALAAAKKRGDDLVLIDTAGRLQNKTDLMAELDKIVRVIKKQDASLPHDVLLVLDATVGQNAHSQVEHFREITNVTGLIVTKLDGTARGGVVVALAERFGLPIHAIGIGEGVDDMRPFRAKDFARSLVGLED